MRILHIFHNYGAFIKNQIIEENRLGIYSKGIYYSLNKSNITSADPNLIEIVKGNSRLKGNFTLQYRLKSIWNQICDAVDSEKPDLVYAHISSVDGQLALLIKKKYGIPYVTAIRNTDINNSYVKSDKNRKKIIGVLTEASYIYVLCGAYIEKLKCLLPSDVYKLISSKIKVTANGIDAFWLEDLASPKIYTDDQINIVTAGDICRNKGQLYTAKAIKQMIKEGYNIKYTIIGKNKNRFVFNYLSKMPFVQILPFAQKEELCKIYDSATVFVLVSKHETFGIVYPEAMSRGVPIIYNCSEGFGGRYPDGVVGYSVQYGDIYGLQNCIKKVLQEYSKLSNCCISEIKNYSWKNITLDYISDYEKIIDF